MKVAIAENLSWRSLLETWLYLFGSSMLVNWSFAYCWGGSQHCPCTCCLHKKETTTGFTAISHLQFGTVSTLKLLSQAEERPKLRSQTRVSMQNYRFTCFCRYIAICSSQDLSSKGFGMNLLGFFLSCVPSCYHPGITGRAAMFFNPFIERSRSTALSTVAITVSLYISAANSQCICTSPPNHGCGDSTHQLTYSMAAHCIKAYQGHNNQMPAHASRLGAWIAWNVIFVVLEVHCPPESHGMMAAICEPSLKIETHGRKRTRMVPVWCVGH